MRRAIRWVAYAIPAWLVVNALAYIFSLFMPKAGTPIQNFAMVLLIGLIIVTLFCDVLYIRRTRSKKDAAQAKEDGARQDLVGTIVELDFPLIITAIFLLVEVVVIFMIAFV